MITCVFDCETIPDVNLIRQTFEVEGDDLEVTNKALKIYEEEKGNSFLPLEYHQIVTISAVILKDGRFSKVNSIKGENEEEILSEFLHFLNRNNPRLISFNGRGFDIPAILVRAMRYNISCPAYFAEKDNKGLKDKWNNYRSRFSDRFHLDLMDVLGNFGATRNLSLNNLSKMLGLPGKLETEGSDVMQLYYQGEMEKIKEYCEGDALNTFFIFLKYLLLKGELDLEKYKQHLETVLQKEPFSQEQPDKNYVEPFKEFIKKEIDGSSHRN